jgi:hypothetical protein
MAIALALAAALGGTNEDFGSVYTVPPHLTKFPET